MGKKNYKATPAKAPTRLSITPNLGTAKAIEKIIAVIMNLGTYLYLLDIL
jgi:hypothetical protein